MELDFTFHWRSWSRGLLINKAMILLLKLMVSGSVGKDPGKHLGKFINLCPIDFCATIYMLKVMHVLNAFPDQALYSTNSLSAAS